MQLRLKIPSLVILYLDNKKLHKLNILMGGGSVIFHIADVVNCQVEDRILKSERFIRDVS